MFCRSFQPSRHNDDSSLPNWCWYQQVCKVFGSVCERARIESSCGRFSRQPHRSRFFNLGDASPKWGHEMILGGRELDSTIINISLILSKSFYFPGLKCYIVQCQAFSHILILTWADAVEKNHSKWLNVHGFSDSAKFQSWGHHLDKKIRGTW